MKDGRTSSYSSEYGSSATSADTSANGTVVYTYPDGRKLRVRGNRPVRNNNPGNLKFSSDEKARKAGALGRDKDGFGVFPDWRTGMRAADAMWTDMRSDGYTIRTAVEKFTTSDRKKRIKDLLDKAKGYVDTDGKPVTENTPLAKLTDEQFKVLVDYNNYQLEGWRSGQREATSEWIETPPQTSAPGSSGHAPVNNPRPGPNKAPAPTNRLELNPDPAPSWIGNPSYSSSVPSFQSRNLLASAPAFEGPYKKTYAPVAQAQAAAPLSNKPAYSLKDKFDFLGKVYPHAKSLSEKTGLSPPLYPRPHGSRGRTG